jgi:hypothetical protein
MKKSKIIRRKEEKQRAILLIVLYSVTVTTHNLQAPVSKIKVHQEKNDFHVEACLRLIQIQEAG